MLAHPILYWETIAMAFSTTGTSGDDGLSSEINVTPLIDVLLVMLIILMVIVPVLPRGLSSAISAAATPGVTEDANRPFWCRWSKARRGVRYRGRSRHGERRGRAATIGAFVTKIVRQVLLEADAKLDFGVIAGVIDAGQAAGAERVGLVTPGSYGLPR
jgi:biopolymer transport protein ExbD